MLILCSAFCEPTSQIFCIAGLYHGLLLVAITTVSKNLINHGVISGKPHLNLKLIMFLFMYVS